LTVNLAVHTTSGAAQDGVADRQVGDPVRVIRPVPGRRAVTAHERLLAGASETTSLIVTASPLTSGSPQLYVSPGSITEAVPPTSRDTSAPLSPNRSTAMEGGTADADGV
jgi:hypothetical protein